MEGDKAGFHRRLREAFEAAGISQAELARRTNTTPPSVSDWFRRGAMPSGDAMLRLPEALGVSADWLLYGTGPRERTTQDDADPFQAGAALAVKKMMAAIWEILETTGLSADGAERELTERERRELENMERVTRDLQQLQGVRRPKQRDAGG